MKYGIHHQKRRVVVGLALYWLSALNGGLWTSMAFAQSEQPIAYIGHGAFFDHTGKQIPLTQAFVEQAQAWYREDLLRSLGPKRKKAFTRFEEQLRDGVEIEPLIDINRTMMEGLMPR